MITPAKVMQSSTTCNRHYWNDPNEYPPWLFTEVTRPKRHSRQARTKEQRTNGPAERTPDTGQKPLCNTYTPNHCNGNNGRILNDYHGQKLKCRAVPYSPMPLKVAWGGGLANYSSHDSNMVLIEQCSHPLLTLQR